MIMVPGHLTTVNSFVIKCSLRADFACAPQEKGNESF